MATNPKIQRLYVHEVTLTKNLQRAVADTTAVHKDYNPVTQPKGEIAKVLFNHLLNKETERNPLNISIDANGNVVPASANNYGMDEPIQESNTRKDMKQNKKTINEAQLRAIVKEAVRNVLKENDLDAQESMYQIICNLEADIKTVISNTDSSSNQAFGDSQDKLNAISNSLSHIDDSLAQQSRLTFAKLLEVISELQDIRISLKALGAKDSYCGHSFKTTNGTVGLSNYSR